MDNLADVASEMTRMYGLVPEINTKEVIEVNASQYEVVQISSLGGACWVVNCLTQLEIPRYFMNRRDLSKFKEGNFIE